MTQGTPGKVAATSGITASTMAAFFWAYTSHVDAKRAEDYAARDKCEELQRAYIKDSNKVDHELQKLRRDMRLMQNVLVEMAAYQTMHYRRPKKSISEPVPLTRAVQRMIKPFSP